MTDAEYYIMLHEKNKKYLESLNLDIIASGPTRIIDRDGENLLVELTKRGTSSITTYLYVRVKDSSTGKKVFLSVPSNMRSCRQAISWTFGLKPSEYDLLFET
ncbi:MAG: hypothetical protein ACFE9S_14620 [Candidatus Hermodarchaeota archaeon]